MVERLRKAIEASRAAWQGPRWRCSTCLRKEIVDYARHEVDAGVSVRATASQLGVSNTTLTRWLEEVEQTSTFRPVQIAAASGTTAGQIAHSPVVTEQETSRVLVLVSPGGYRVEGLDVEQLAQLLSRLG